MMKIAFITPSMQVGGAERSISILTNYLCKDMEVYIIAYDNKDSFYKINQKVKYRKLNVYNTNTRNRISNLINRGKKIRKQLKTDEIDVAICMNWKVLSIVLLSKIFLKVKVIGTERSNPYFNSKSKLILTYQKIISNLCDGFIFQTKGSSEFFYNKTRSKGIVIPNPSIPDNTVIRNEENINNIVFSIGRFVEGKSHKTIFEALSILNKQGIKIDFHMYGDGKLKEEYIKQCKELKIDDCITFEGNVTNIKKAIKNNKLYVSTSLYEGMPNALLESMSLGIPSISTRCKYGPEEIINNYENGILIDIKDSNALAESIKLLLNDKELYKKISKNAIKINETLSIENIGKRWTKYLIEIANK